MSRSIKRGAQGASSLIEAAGKAELALGQAFRVIRQAVLLIPCCSILLHWGLYHPPTQSGPKGSPIRRVALAGLLAEIMNIHR